ncbi:MAG TPA: hypothetical protein VLG50_05240 [Candidatus Saccharimonadales bacterium]|nr:hypothetical protein [Candidatus Saccharimonadales bacterium]
MEIELSPEEFKELFGSICELKWKQKLNCKDIDKSQIFDLDYTYFVPIMVKHYNLNHTTWRMAFMNKGNYDLNTTPLMIAQNLTYVFRLSPTIVTHYTYETFEETIGVLDDSIVKKSKGVIYNIIDWQFFVRCFAKLHNLKETDIYDIGFDNTETGYKFIITLQCFSCQKHVGLHDITESTYNAFVQQMQQLHLI